MKATFFEATRDDEGALGPVITLHLLFLALHFS